MNAQVIMYKKAEGYEWLVVDLHTVKVLEAFPAGNLNGAHEAMDRYNAEAEDAERATV